MDRRLFINRSVKGSLVLLMPFYACMPNKEVHKIIDRASMTNFQKQCFDLLQVWCDAMIKDQIDNTKDPVTHGALYCRACNEIHGRANDAIYPLMYMADATGHKKYLEAAIKLMDWSKNVDKPDGSGSWTNDLNPKSWNGITVFTAIALGEALHHHGHLLSAEVKQKWDTRLKAGIDFVYREFDMHYSHINYRFTAIYALRFLGAYFQEEKYITRSREFAKLIPKYLTAPNKLIFGEDKPDNGKSAKGLYPVDLGYNVEETLNGLVQYAMLENDESLLKLLTESMNGHLEFMLPDGAWDNSWGTRQNKWTYWGSRTTDGCQPAFALMANRNSAFGTAAIKNTELLQRCTVNGLLAGGLHYKTHGVKPCMHHTFSHAKNLAVVLDNTSLTTVANNNTSLPRLTSNGVKHFPELDVWLGARGPWRTTVSSYDQVWKKKYSVAGTGGALNILWHEKTGPLFTASMAEYIEVEIHNQQPQPGIDFCLTPRVERFVNGIWYTNIHDLKAKVTHKDTAGDILFNIDTVLTNREKERLNDADEFNLRYIINNNKTTIKAYRSSKANNGDTLVLPLISSSKETYKLINKNVLEVYKDGATVVVTANVDLGIKTMKNKRIFNQVPGMEVLPIIINFPELINEIICTIYVK